VVAMGTRARTAAFERGKNMGVGVVR
jgi:hypothetical protein